MASKRETHRAELRPLLLAALTSPGLLSPSEFQQARYSLNAQLRPHLIDPDVTALEDYLLDHCALPGPRSNLEMIAAFADEVAALSRAPDVSLRASYVALEWLLWQLMHRYPPESFGHDADSPLQIPQVVGAVAWGEWAACFQHIEAGVATLLALASSPLWRVREAAAMGLQRMLERAWEGTLRRMMRCVPEADAWQWRALVAGVAEPALLRAPGHAQAALDLHYPAMAYLRDLSAEAKRGEAARVLRQALGYTVSVVTAAAPEAGFAQMHAWAAWGDRDVAWVLRENLKKKRLAAWPEAVAALSVRL